MHGFIIYHFFQTVLQAHLEQIQFMNMYLQQECRHTVHLHHQITSRDQKNSKLQQVLDQSKQILHEDDDVSTAKQKLDLELQLEQQSFEQRMATESEHAHRAERERQAPRQEVEQVQDEIRRISGDRQAMNKELEAIAGKNQQLQFMLATERSMLDEAKHA